MKIKLSAITLGFLVFFFLIPFSAHAKYSCDAVCTKYTTTIVNNPDGTSSTTITPTTSTGHFDSCHDATDYTGDCSITCTGDPCPLPKCNDFTTGHCLGSREGYPMETCMAEIDTCGGETSVPNGKCTWIYDKYWKNGAPDPNTECDPAIDNDHSCYINFCTSGSTCDTATYTCKFPTDCLTDGITQTTCKPKRCSSYQNCSNASSCQCIDSAYTNACDGACNLDVPVAPPPLGEIRSEANSPCLQFDADHKCLKVGSAIGEINTEPSELIKTLFSFVLGIGGGIALILIILAGYRYVTSRGNPEAVKAANEQLTSAVVGLLFIILSFVILEIIGVDILKIPGFTH
jgi:hypothetical protein